MKKFFKKIGIYATVATLTLSSVPMTATAHSGRTDSSGGHRDNKNVSGLGSYHYHCGSNPPHLHTGGGCPYSSNYNVNTASSSDSSGSTNLTASQTTVVSSTISTSGKTVKLNSGSTVGISKELIMIVQDVLNQKGYDCGIPDGIVGNKTKEAISKFLEKSDNAEDTDAMIIKMIAEGLGIEVV